jgi:hypothetical protein
MVQQILDFPDFFVRDVGEVAIFGQILPDQAVGMLVEASVAGSERPCEVGFRL